MTAGRLSRRAERRCLPSPRGPPAPTTAPSPQNPAVAHGALPSHFVPEGSVPSAVSPRPQPFTTRHLPNQVPCDQLVGAPQPPASPGQLSGLSPQRPLPSSLRPHVLGKAFQSLLSLTFYLQTQPFAPGASLCLPSLRLASRVDSDTYPAAPHPPRSREQEHQHRGRSPVAPVALTTGRTGRASRETGGGAA